MDVDVMREYVRLAQTLNFTRTAQEFFITQPTLSRHIANMEKELGATLILRSTHEAELTDEGRTVASHLSDVLETYDAMLSDVDKIKRGATGHLSLGFLYYGGMSYLREGLDRYAQAHPSVEIDYLSQQPYQVVEGLLDGSIDLGLTFRVTALPERDFAFVPVHDCKMYAFLPEGHRLATRTSLDPQDLRGERLVLTQVDPWYNEAMLGLADAAGIEVIPDRCCRQIDLFPQAVTKSDGFLLGTGHMPHTPGDGLAMIPINHDSGALTMGLYHRLSNDNPAIPGFVAMWEQGV